MKPDTIAAQEWARELADEWGERAFRWLLERDLEEPEEKLFTVTGREQEGDGALSDAETRLGARHMLGGMPGGDDLSAFIEEEIVLTSVGSSASDIYASSSTPSALPPDEPPQHNFIAVEHSRVTKRQPAIAELEALEGVDVLGIGPPPPLPAEAEAATEAAEAAEITTVEATDVAPAAISAAATDTGMTDIAPPAVAASDDEPDSAPPIAATPEQLADPIPATEIPAAPAPPAADEFRDDAEARPEPVPDATSDHWSWCVPRDITFTFSTRGGGELYHDFLDAFLEEAGTELEKLEDALGAWERDIADPGAADTVGRVLHTIKGIAKGVGLQRYGTLVHNFETLLAALPRPQESGEQEYFRLVNAWLDTAVRGYDHIQATRSDIASELPLQTDGPASTPATPQSATASAPRLQPLTAGGRQQERELADEGAKVLSAQQTIRISPDSLDHLLNLGNEVQKLGCVPPRVRSGASVRRRNCWAV
ncbi:Hpt domain-containing protein [Kineobactrum salinum]|uniref:HPt domain-containing protein n=1 Tax=Kineobactrum salinum TaxID=2708301 RepID=A0A6C0U0V5_9GAMM|nr:Hpt domain-containing protein [Kineobactrum salinum]QIB65646.1 hypothetical protein G3T16_09725 [Kineobactrum salinum]